MVGQDQVVVALGQRFLERFTCPDPLDFAFGPDLSQIFADEFRIDAAVFEVKDADGGRLGRRGG
jgi:hypothetical protein